MKIQINGKYHKANSHWVVELPSLLIAVEGTNPISAFRNLEKLIQKEIGLECECSFRIYDDGRFRLDAGKTSELVNYIARKIHQIAESSDDIGNILSEIKFNGDLED